MTRRLFLMRHGEAGWGYPDHERELTPHGHEQAARMAGWFGQQSLEGVRLHVSPYVRARQTASHVAGALGSEPQVLPIITPDDSPQAVCDWLLGEDHERPLILVSHMPLVGELAALLVEGRAGHGLAFATAAVAELRSDVWAAGCARLLRFIAPHDLS